MIKKLIVIFILGIGFILDLFLFSGALMIISLIFAIPAVIFYGLATGLKKRGKFFKLSLSMLIVLITSHIKLLLTQPCQQNELSRFGCDFYYGFPIPFWLVTDFLHPIMVVLGVIAFLVDSALWYVVITLIEKYMIRKSSNRPKTIT